MNSNYRNLPPMAKAMAYVIFRDCKETGVSHESLEVRFGNETESLLSKVKPFIVEKENRKYHPSDELKVVFSRLNLL